MFCGTYTLISAYLLFYSLIGIAIYNHPLLYYCRINIFVEKLTLNICYHVIKHSAGQIFRIFIFYNGYNI